jgi:hypothetical protein
MEKRTSHAPQDVLAASAIARFCWSTAGLLLHPVDVCSTAPAVGRRSAARLSRKRPARVRLRQRTPEHFGQRVR